MVTIEKIAKTAGVSSPTIYALFQSKRGVLSAVMDAFPVARFEALVEQWMAEPCPRNKLKITAKITRQMYDAEKEQMDLLRGAAVLSPELKVMENEREERRYKRQEETLKMLYKEKALKPGLTLKKARDIFWAFTGRDLYRLFVGARGWSPAAYEKWLASLLIDNLLA